MATSNEKPLDDLLLDTLKDIYYAERQILKALPKMAKAVRSAWQRGTHENTNGLLRQYVPRATNFSRLSQAQLDDVALRLNQRPRKALDFETPADRLHKVLQ